MSNGVLVHRKGVTHRFEEPPAELCEDGQLGDRPHGLDLFYEHKVR